MKGTILYDSAALYAVVQLLAPSIRKAFEQQHTLYGHDYGRTTLIKFSDGELIFEIPLFTPFFEKPRSVGSSVSVKCTVEETEFEVPFIAAIDGEEFLESLFKNRAPKMPGKLTIELSDSSTEAKAKIAGRSMHVGLWSDKESSTALAEEATLEQAKLHEDQWLAFEDEEVQSAVQSSVLRGVQSAMAWRFGGGSDEANFYDFPDPKAPKLDVGNAEILNSEEKASRLWYSLFSSKDFAETEVIGTLGGSALGHSGSASVMSPEGKWANNMVRVSADLLFNTDDLDHEMDCTQIWSAHFDSEADVPPTASTFEFSDGTVLTVVSEPEGLSLPDLAEDMEPLVKKTDDLAFLVTLDPADLNRAVLEVCDSPLESDLAVLESDGEHLLIGLHDGSVSDDLRAKAKVRLSSSEVLAKNKNRARIVRYSDLLAMSGALFVAGVDIRIAWGGRNNNAATPVLFSNTEGPGTGMLREVPVPNKDDIVGGLLAAEPSASKPKSKAKPKPKSKAKPKPAAAEEDQEFEEDMPTNGTASAFRAILETLSVTKKVIIPADEKTCRRISNNLRTLKHRHPELPDFSTQTGTFIPSIFGVDDLTVEGAIRALLVTLTEDEE